MRFRTTKLRVQFEFFHNPDAKTQSLNLKRYRKSMVFIEKYPSNVDSMKKIIVFNSIFVLKQF